jgi:hypothetical protein
MNDTSDTSDTSDMDKMSDESRRLDGNAAAGMLEEIFAFDVTSARSTCAGCGQTYPVGALLLYGGEVGIVLRCPSCKRVQLRVARHGDQSGQYWIDLRGMAVLRIAPTSPA